MNGPCCRLLSLFLRSESQEMVILVVGRPPHLSSLNQDNHLPPSGTPQTPAPG